MGNWHEIRLRIRTLTTTNSPKAANTKIMQPAIHKSNAFDEMRTTINEYMNTHSVQNAVSAGV